jgi:hypothetical protein
MSKQYSLTACLFWVCSVATAQVMLPAFQGVFNNKEVTVPGAPINPIAAADYAQAIVSFSVPASTGGSTITGYTATSSPGGFTASGAASPLTITGLSNGTSYTFVVVATNALGNSLASVASNAVIPQFVCGTSTVTFTYNGASVTYGTVSRAYGGTLGTKCWLDRNLGASQVATSNTDFNSYGSLFQWGRGVDGHQTIVWASSTTSNGAEQSYETTLPSASTTPGTNFITGSQNWYNGANPNNLWQGVSGINNPCPSGYRLPTDVEWTAETNIWSSKNAAGAFASPLKLPIAGYRSFSNGSLGGAGGGLYWSSTINVTVTSYSNRWDFNSGATGSGSYRAFGASVRCIKD